MLSASEESSGGKGASVARGEPSLGTQHSHRQASQAALSMFLPHYQVPVTATATTAVGASNRAAEPHRCQQATRCGWPPLPAAALPPDLPGSLPPSCRALASRAG